MGVHRTHLVRHGPDEMAEEVERHAPRCLPMWLDEGERGRGVDGDERLEPPFGRMNLGQIDVQVAERVGLEARALGLDAVDLRQSADAVALQASM